jgi:pyridoxine 4-dehydrogenase
MSPGWSVRHRHLRTYLLNNCGKNQIAFIPRPPIGQNRQANEVLERTANEIGATPLQVALAWLRGRRSSVVLPIAGTSPAAQVEENVAAARIALPDELFKKLSEATTPPARKR